MKITSSQKFAPFSHRPGARTVIPGSEIVVTAYPTLLVVGDERIEIPVSGRVEGFTLMQDLDRRCLFVFSKSYRIKITPERISGSIERELGAAPFTGDVARLCLGVHKKQEIERMRAREDIREFLPLLFLFSQMSSRECDSSLQGGVFDLEEFSDLLLAGFSDLFVPRLFDDDYQGIVSGEAPNVSPFTLLPLLSQKIQTLFIDGDTVLPHRLSQLHAGRLLGVRQEGIIFDIEWSKKCIRRMVAKVGADQERSFQFQPGIKSFRLRCTQDKKGTRHTVGQPLPLQEGCTYFFDQFAK